MLDTLKLFDTCGCLDRREVLPAGSGSASTRSDTEI